MTREDQIDSPDSGDHSEYKRFSELQDYVLRKSEVIGKYVKTKKERCLLVQAWKTGIEAVRDR